MNDKPSLRWGIAGKPQALFLYYLRSPSNSRPIISGSSADLFIGTGMISSWFSTDILFSRPDAKAQHSIVAIASSSMQKGATFANAHCADTSTKIYDDYSAMYADPRVDIVYVGTPHAMHKRNTLEAIAAGKHVLCEKPMAVNSKDAREMIDAAQKKGVFLMEGKS